MLNSLLIFFFKLAGWKLEGEFPQYLKKTICIVAPHARTADFPIGLGARAVIERTNHVQLAFLGKEELFKGAFGWLFRSLGGIPVDRFSKNDMVKSVGNLFTQNESLHIVIAPEGTRKPVSKLRTGFYYMAKYANVPIVMIAFDFPKKAVIIGKVYYLTDNMEEDLKEIARYYNTIGGVKKEWIANTLATDSQPIINIY
jgi:1-acyl-sn-glycerol-3-phosphate acyltransferase